MERYFIAHVTKRINSQTMEVQPNVWKVWIKQQPKEESVFKGLTKLDIQKAFAASPIIVSTSTSLVMVESK